jgi:hypothetical protein
MNLAEHPLALDLMKRLNASEAEDKTLPVLIYMPVMGRLEGALRQGDVPGVFIVASQVEIKDGGRGESQRGVMDFTFTADKPIVIIHPNLTQAKPVSRIVQ